MQREGDHLEISGMSIRNSVGIGRLEEIMQKHKQTIHELVEDVGMLKKYDDYENNFVFIQISDSGLY